MQRNIERFYPLALAPLLLLAACERSDIERRPCRDDCRLTITLSDNAALAPRESLEAMHVVGGAEVEIVVQGGPAGKGATVLRFEAPDLAFVNAAGRPMDIVPLVRGRNVYRVRPHEDGACHPPDGCKYVIANTGNPERPERDPHMIIHPY